MTANFLIGLGGSGAKCVEAFAHLAACGIGPDRAWVGLLDQDSSNGNSGRTQQVLTDYVALRRRLRAPGGLDLGSGCGLLGTEIEGPRGGWAWAPDGRSSQTLARAIGYGALAREQQKLAAALFTAEERDLTLDEGFRQRPALGAAMTLTNVSATSAIWADLIRALRAAGHGTEVRVFLMGSIFGGTGASALPTVARLLRDEIDKNHLAGRVKLGAALLLPYFSFDLPPPDPGDGPAIRPDSSTFLMQARGALEYYAGPAAHEVFDRLYVLGCNPVIQVPTYAPGGPKQVNPPLFPELLAALAAVDFVHARPEVRGETVGAGAPADRPLGWPDLPYAGTGGAAALRRAVGATVRLGMAWRCVYAPALSGDRWRALKCHHEAWFSRLLEQPGDQPIASPETQEAIAPTGRLLDGVLDWLVAMSRMGAGGARGIALVEDGLIADKERKLFAGIHDRAFARLVAAQRGPSLRELFARLTYGPVPRDGAGLGRLLAAMHAACAEERAAGGDA